MNIRAIVLAIAFARIVIGQYTIHVHVVDKTTGASVAGANVVMAGLKDEQIWGRTDAVGEFSATTSSTDKRVLIVTQPGYRMTGGGVMGRSIDIRAGAENQFTVEMLPLGVITGRVVDQYGDPILNARVSGLKKLQLPDGSQEFASTRTAFTDDRGQFRISNVEPGQYYVAAEYSERNGPPTGRRSTLRWPEFGGFAFFPSGVDAAGAQQTEVRAGAATRIAEVHLPLQRALTISGHVRPTPHQSIGNLMLRRAPPYLPLDAFAVHGGQSEADGSFKYRVLPGTYLLSASDRKSGKVSPEITIEARDKDITGIELTLDSSYEITGRIAVDGSASLDYTKLDLSFLGERVKISSDGSFHDSADGHTCQYFLHGVPENWYLKNVTVAGQHLDGRQFELKPGTTEIAFTLSPDGASVEATRPPGTSAVDTVMVLLLPENGPLPDVESLLLLQRDQAGRMIAHGVPPGSYRVFGLDATNWLLVMNTKQFMEKYGKSAPLIEIAAGEHKSIVVTPTKIQPESENRE